MPFGTRLLNGALSIGLVTYGCYGVYVNELIIPGRRNRSSVVVHDEGDSVGVVVVEGVSAGAEIQGWVMDQDRDIGMTAVSDIPIGHKLAIRPIAAGDTVIKYGVDIGRAVADVRPGEHLHIHNLKTKR